jgi:hypothetical protein
MPRLVAQSEEFAGRIIELNGSKLTLGRVEDNDVQIEHNSVSSHHAELLQDGGDFKVKDLDSTNGTRVNGERVQESKLRRGDIARFGNIEFLYDSEFAPPVQPMPEPSPGIDLAMCSSRGKPAHFVNTSPFPKLGKKDKVPWGLILGGLGLLTAGTVGFFFFKMFVAE